MTTEIDARRRAAVGVVVLFVVLLLAKLFVVSFPCPQEPRLSIIHGVQLYFGACR